MSDSIMSETEKNEILKNWLDQTMELLKNADEAQLFQIKKRLDPFLRRTCSSVDCRSKNTKRPYYECAY